MIIGVLAAAIILIGQAGFYQYKFQDREISIEQTEQSSETNDQSPETDYFIVNHDAVNTIFQVNLDHALYQIGQIVHEPLDEEWIELGEIIPVREYMETLLQIIISPNAP